MPIVERTFNEFHKLSTDLKASNYANVPDLPPKTILQVKSEKELLRRKEQLKFFLQIIFESRMLRNSREFIRFLNLDQLCPEFLINPPALLFQEKEKANYVVSLIHYIPQHDIFVTVSNNKKVKQAVVKVYSFKKQINDSFTIKQTAGASNNHENELKTPETQHRTRSFRKEDMSLVTNYNIDCMS